MTDKFTEQDIENLAKSIGKPSSPDYTQKTVERAKESVSKKPNIAPTKGKAPRKAPSRGKGR